MKYGFCSHGDSIAFSVVGGVGRRRHRSAAHRVGEGLLGLAAAGDVVVEVGSPELLSGSVAEKGVDTVPYAEPERRPAAAST